MDNNLSVVSRFVAQKPWWLIVLAVMATSVSANQESDPTAPLGWMKKQQVKKARQVPVPELQSIVCKGSEECYAILNGQVVENGENVAGYSVTQVTPTQVELKRGTKSWALELFSLDIKE